MLSVPERELEDLSATLQAAVGRQQKAAGEMLAQIARLRRVCEILPSQEIAARLELLAEAVEARAAELEEARQLLLDPGNSIPEPSFPDLGVDAGAGAARPGELDAAFQPDAPTTPTEINGRGPALPGGKTLGGRSRAGGEAIAESIPVPAKRPVTVPRPPAWSPRPLELLEELLEQFGARVEPLQNGNAVDLTTCKSIVALYRGAHLERQRHPGSQSGWNDFGRTLRERLRQGWPDHTCLPFSDLNLAPAQWEQLAELYLQLGEAQASLDWLEEAAATEPAAWLGRDATGVLEACAAVLSRLWRWIQSHLVGRREEQLHALYERLRALTATRSINLRALQPADVVGDSEIDALAADLQTRLRTLRDSMTKRHRKTAAIEAFRAFIDEPGWGSREGDDEQTCALAFACLRAGVPATDKQLRDPFLDCSWMLEDEPELTRLAEAVRSEGQRRQKLGDPGVPVPDESLPRELAEQLAGVLPMTNGLRGVIVGGLPREETRKAIQETLELSDLKWPATDPADTFERSRAAIRKADVVFLTRFNRRKAREAYRICNEEDKLLVVLPKGYGLHEVIYRMHLRLGGDSLQPVGA